MLNDVVYAIRMSAAGGNGKICPGDAIGSPRSDGGGNKTVLPESPNPRLRCLKLPYAGQGAAVDLTGRRNRVWDKVAEEIGEFRTELDSMDASDPASVERAESELGDLLFAVVNAARLYDLNPDTALEMTCRRFKERFTYLELKSKELGRNLKDMTLDEMDAIWDEAKSKGL